ncbi:MAG: GspE/PulE family protein [Parcubacteria group bacterium]|jgi:type IV pilus assembly protein PilB
MNDGKNKTKDSIEIELAKRAQQLGVPYVYKFPDDIDKDVVFIIPENLVLKHQMIAFDKEDDLIRVAMVDVHDIEALNVLRFLTGKEGFRIEIYLTNPEKIKDMLRLYSNPEKIAAEAAMSLKEEEKEIKKSKKSKEEKIQEIIQDAPVTKLVEVIVNHAVEGRASDIHIEPIDDKYRVRFRIDGVLHPSLFISKDVGRAVVSRIKILSNLKIDEQRKPQDGRFQIKDGKKITDFRVSTFPVVEGEKVVMRVLDRTNQVFDLESLGLIGRNHEIFDKRIRDPFGIVLITGPTGSGKSTTLYGFLKILNQEERNIVTLEDPVEYYIGGVNQSQIKPEIGYTFANGLRSILRQDPNVIMVGEIRDNETAELAIHAALTGHLVFSTLHTNDAVGSIPRLIDMGIEPFLLASSLKVVAAQRLVRKICENCKEEIDVPEKIYKKIEQELSIIPKEELKKYGVDLSEKLKFYSGKGCGECGNLGLKGRIAIYEVIEISSSMQELISGKSGNEVAVKMQAEKEGMITMRQDGLLKVLKGVTVYSEIDRVTKGSMSIGGEIEDV